MRVGVVGCGYVSQYHLRSLRRLRDVEVVGICDSDSDRVASAARAHGIPKAYGSLTELLAVRPDVVHVLTPPRTHANLALEALGAGCHVLVEKPMAANAAEARAILEVAGARRRHLCVCHNYLALGAFVRARALVERGTLGRVLSADIFWRMSSAHRGQSAAWMGEGVDGPIQEVAPHLIYLLQAVVGELRIVSALRVPAADSPAAELRVLLRTESGPAVLGISLASRPVAKIMTIHGTRATLRVDFASNVLTSLRTSKDGLRARGLTNLSHAAQLVSGTVGNAALGVFGRLPRSHDAFISTFYEALREGREPPAGPEDGLAVVTVLDALWDRLAEGRDPG